MSSNLNICDLSPDLILMTTDYLPYQDKIKLIDLFPCVRSQIKVFDTSSMGNYSIAQKMSLFEKLTNVSEVTGYPFKQNSFSGDSTPLGKLISSGSNKRIKHFFDKLNGPIRYTSVSRELGILTYIENVKKRDPSYDASCIENIFDIRSQNVIQLTEKYPDLKLKFGLEFGSRSDEHSDSVWEPLLKNPSLHDRIVYVKLNGNSIRLIPNEIQRPFESVVELNLMDIIGGSGGVFMDNLKQILSLTPNLMRLELYFKMSELLGDDEGANGVKIGNEFISCLFSVTKLNHLHLTPCEFSWPEKQKDIDIFQNIMNQLLTSRQKPGLKKLYIHFAYENWDMVQTVSNLDIRNDFKCLELHNLRREQHLRIQNHGIKICNIQPSIQYLFSRFPKIKWIEITTFDESHRLKVKQEYQSIKNGLPRNRWLQINLTRGTWCITYITRRD